MGFARDGGRGTGKLGHAVFEIGVLRCEVVVLRMMG